MIAAAAWVWALVGIVLVLVLGLAAALALGLLESLGTVLRRPAATGEGRRSDRGEPLPDEVPDTTPAEAAEQAERRSRAD